MSEELQEIKDWLKKQKQLTVKEDVEEVLDLAISKCCELEEASISEDKQNLILQALSQDEEMTVGQLTKATGLPRDKVKTGLRVLIQRDSVEVARTEGRVDFVTLT